MTVFFDNPDQYLADDSSRLRKAEALHQINKGLSMATAGVLPQYTFRQEYVVYDSSQARLSRIACWQARQQNGLPRRQLVVRILN